MKALIYLVEDDPGMADVTAALLARRGHRVKSMSTAEEALDLIRTRTPDLLVSDVQLPGLSGFKLCELLKGQPRTARLPILLLTVLDKEKDVVAGLRLGADDYLKKPYGPEELAARVDNLLRRAGAAPETTVLEAGPLRVDVERREATLKGKPVSLRRKEFELLVLLLRQRGKLLTRERIVADIWPDNIVTENTLSVHMRNLRDKLGPLSDAVKTLIGEGYKFDLPE